MRGLFSFLIVALVALACKDKYEACDYSEINECYVQLALDSAGMRSRLIGKWRWELSLDCAGTYSKDGPEDDTRYAGLVVEFFSNGEGRYQGNNAIGNFHWSISIVHTFKPAYEILDETVTPILPPHRSLYGRIRLCDDRLLLYDSGSDGSDNYFRRE